MSIEESIDRVRMPSSVRSGIVAAYTALGLAACGRNAVTGPFVDDRSQTVLAAVDQEVNVTLGNVGGPVYGEPPHISSAALLYLDVSAVPPYTPGGVRQRFRFRAAAPGVAIITFRKVRDDSSISIVEDTVQVR